VVNQPYRRASRGSGSAIAPGHQQEQGGQQLTAGLGEVVVVPGRPVLVLAALQDAVRHQVRQPAGEQVPGYLQVLRDVVETVQP
jgi:hypothetical protein